MKEADLVEIGRVVAINIGKNSVIIKASTDFPERFISMNTLELYDDERHISVTLHSVSVKGDVVNAVIAEKLDLTALRGMYVKVRRGDVFKLPPGMYYIFDIIDCQVFDANGNFIGKVVDVIKTGSNDVYQIKREGKKDLFIPALRDVVKKVDLKVKRIDVCLPEGLMEIYED